MTYRTPPPGWSTFGTHVDAGPAHLLFSTEYDDDGLPFWEKPCPGCEVCRAMGSETRSQPISRPAVDTVDTGPIEGGDGLSS